MSSASTDGAPVARRAGGLGVVLSVKRWTESVLFSVLAALLLALVVIIGLQVLYRYVLNDSLTWTDEAARLVLVWMTFVGGGLASFRGVHLRLDLLAERLGKAGHRLASLVVAAFVLAFLAVLFLGNMEVIDVREGIPFTSFALSSKYLSYAISVGAVLMAVGTLVSLIVEWDAAPRSTER